MVARRSQPYELLLADDDAEFRRTLRLVLEPHVVLCEAACGEEALDIIRTRPVDLVLLDMNMRALTGLETLRAVKTLRAALPCILITASFTDELRQKAIRADAFCVLKKPVSRRLLIRTVSQALQSAYDDPEAVDWFRPSA
jgi:CheY-like chemotaxis protein